ncbi:eukaryotic translation initiation factor 3 subunit M-like [Clavelina lepadiformis]|uniref:Eukaryotic translation initiation factor 3 subunit M n=1 Tax=Clavelina lepadiformis TaxID=159417 RepID=A0ABP0GRY4_CLALP
MSVSAFIDITETDQISELREYFESKSINVAKVTTGELFDEVKAVITATSEIWKENDPKDVEGIVNSILSLLILFPLEKGKELVTLLCQNLIIGAESGKASISLKLLHNLFHGYDPKTPFLFNVYSTWIKVAGNSRNIQLVPTDLEQIETWLNWWKMGDDERRELLRLLYGAHINCGKSEEAATVMVKLLESYTQEDAAKAREDAIKCIVRAIADPNTYLFDQLLALKPVKFLEGELLYDLLNIFVSGNIHDYKEFYESNKEFVESNGMSHKSNLRKMKLLTLVDSVGGSREITFHDVMDRLGILEEDVEEFIIDAMQSKLMRGRIDHVNKKVIVSQACQRTFGRQQWQLLASRLQHWQKNLKRVYDRLQTVQAQG